ncbi:MAG: Crp/Fnr family transcriptional regulator [Arcobacteraceae bacterium]|nr:Crp/Fnr family transcriptional regulator [Arcobacteraceae bacterium]MDY0327864.1 Crp/Fnr family transcriptional regulator [Arcobacteraceae bacterium]
MKNILQNIKYFASFDDYSFERLSSISFTKRLVNGEILFYEGDEPRYIYYLIKGHLKVLKSQGDLKQVYIHTMCPGMLVAEITMFDDILYPATSEAIGECEVLAINKNDFIKDFLNDPSLLREMLKSLSIKVKYLMMSIEFETTLTTEVKIAKFIINHQNEISKIKHKDIAMELNSTPETISRILKKFVTNSFLEKSNPITIKNLQGLRILCN